MILILDLVCTAIYASCFLRLLAKGTSKLCEVGQRSSIFLPDALRKSPCGYERIDIDILHWDPEDASCTAPPKSAADACEDVDGNDVGLRVAVLSRLGSRNLYAPGTSLRIGCLLLTSSASGILQKDFKGIISIANALHISRHLSTVLLHSVTTNPVRGPHLQGRPLIIR